VQSIADISFLLYHRKSSNLRAAQLWITFFLQNFKINLRNARETQFLWRVNYAAMRHLSHSRYICCGRFVGKKDRLQKTY
jgi:hypothetical protein